MSDTVYKHDMLTIERIYPNCREHVWSAWTTLEKKKKWFGDGLKSMEFRPGGLEIGEFETAMGLHRNETRYFEIKDCELIVQAYSMALNGRVHTVSLATIRFCDENGGTRLTYTEQMCVIPPSDGVEGRAHGWRALLDSLGDVLAAETRQTA